MVNHGLSRCTTKSKSVVMRQTSSIGADSSDGKSRRLMALLRLRSDTERGAILSVSGCPRYRLQRCPCHPELAPFGGAAGEVRQTHPSLAEFFTASELAKDPYVSARNFGSFVVPPQDDTRASLVLHHVHKVPV